MFITHQQSFELVYSHVCDERGYLGEELKSWFVHIAVEANIAAGPAEWLEPVTDEEYEKLK